jgi:hypothetical protein
MSSPPSLPTFRHWIVTGIALLHLMWAGLGAFQVPPFQGATPVDVWARGYASWTGANSRFSFFAPGVSPAIRASFDVADAEGRAVQDRFLFDSGAVNVRMHAMMLRFDLKQGRDTLARAWAASMFGRYPEARAVTVRVEAMALPSMEAYREGERPHWLDAYRAGFEHRPATTQAVTP